MAIEELAANAPNRKTLAPLVTRLGRLVGKDPHHAVRVGAAECLAALAAHGKGAQKALAAAALSDEEDWVKASAAKALTAVKADVGVMMPVFVSMIRSEDKLARGEGVSKARALAAQGVDITPLVPALEDLFRKPQFDDSAWQTKTAPLRAHRSHRAKLADHPVSHHSEMYHINQLYHAYARLSFDVADPSAVKALRGVQQNCHQYLRAEVYLNGYRVAAILRPYTCELSGEAVKLLVKGRNCVAIYLASNRGHLHDFDFGLDTARR